MLIHQSNGLSYLTLAPEQLGLYFSPPNSSGQLARTKADEVLAVPGVLAVLDGPMFRDCTNSPPCTMPPRRGCSQGQCNAVLLDYLYLDRRAGEYFEGRYPDRGMTLSVDAQGHTFAAHGANAISNAVVAIQGYPELIWNGENVSSTEIDTSVVWRAAIGVLPTGKLILAVARASMHSFAEKLRAIGVRYAVYTDGGGSAGLQARGEPRVGSTEDRAVASWIVVRDIGLVQASPLSFFDQLTHGATIFGLFTG